MKKIVLIVSALALAGCENQADAPAEGDAVEEVAAAAYPDGPGAFTRSGDNGETVVTTLADDGSYTTVIDGEETSTGTYTVDGANICFEGTNTGDEPECWVNSAMGEDGSFESSSPDGVTYSIQKTEAAE